MCRVSTTRPCYYARTHSDRLAANSKKKVTQSTLLPQQWKRVEIIWMTPKRPLLQLSKYKKRNLSRLASRRTLSSLPE